LPNSHLKVFVEEETEIGKDDPQLLPTIRVLELALKISTQLALTTKHTDNATLFVVEQGVA